MLVGGLIVLLLILGLFLQALTAAPRSQGEWQFDTDDELAPTSAPAETETTVLAA
jgi:hypothetical protein